MRSQKAANDKSSNVWFKASVVQLIFMGKAEAALQMLAAQYNVHVPKTKVGLPPRHKTKTLGCYTPSNQTIYLLNSDVLKEPFIILHEFYHHMRTTIDKKHKGTEKYANIFAQGFIEAYQSLNAHAAKKGRMSLYKRE